jgi:glycosyltransferase involved in cell wall biosynthesis
VVPPRDPAALATALRTLLGDPERRAAMGAAGMETARGYAWPTVAARLEEIYGSLVGPGRAAVPAGDPEARAALLLSAEA